MPRQSTTTAPSPAAEVSPASTMQTRGRSMQASMQASPSASPGQASQLGAMLQGLSLSDRTAVGWHVALKPPKSSNVLVTDATADGEWQEMKADEWLAARMLHQGFTGWVAYNDEPPAGAASGAKFGHCKGVLAWNKTRLGWLVHSTPGWPATLSNDALPPLIASGLKCGQSFLWLGLERSEELTRRISAQIHLMDACVYAGRVTPDEEAHVGFAEDRFGEHLRRPYSLVPPSLVMLGTGVWHLAKDAAWGKVRLDGRPTDRDFYEDALAQTSPFDGSWRVQSWLNGLKDVAKFGCTPHCANVLQVRLPDGTAYQTTKDHSKWGVHGDKPLVIIGDLNRTQTQAQRGGGGVVLQDEGLWRALTSVIVHWGAEHPPPPLPLRSYDEFHTAPGLSGGTSRAGAGQLLQSGAARGTPAPRGRRAASSAAGPAPSDSGSLGGGSDSQAGSVSTASSASKGCRCKSSGCSHGRCGCRRAGRPCTALCSCKGSGANTAAAAEGAAREMADEEVTSRAAALSSAEAAAAVETGPAAAADVALAPSAVPQQLLPPQEAATALGAALASLAAARAAAAAVAVVVPLMQQQQQQQHGDQQPAAAGVAEPEHTATIADVVRAVDGTAGSPPHAQEQCVGEERCRCRKGCKDKRCVCRKAGRACGPQCSCQGCTNCPEAAVAGATPGPAGPGGQHQDGCDIS